MHRVRSLLGLALASSLTALGLVVASPGIAVGNPRPRRAGLLGVRRSHLPGGQDQRRSSLLTPWKSEASGAADYGFSPDDGEVFKASVTRGPGPGRGASAVPAMPAGLPGHGRPERVEVAEARSRLQRPRPASTPHRSRPTACRRSTPMSRAPVTGWAAARRTAALIAAGWRSRESRSTPRSERRQADPSRPRLRRRPEPTPDEPTRRRRRIRADSEPSQPPDPDPDADSDHAAHPKPSPSDDDADDTQFSFAGLAGHPARAAADHRYAVHQPVASGWCSKKSLDLRFATHSGDVVDWDTPDHEQYERASAAMRAAGVGRHPVHPDHRQPRHRCGRRRGQRQDPRP